MPCPFSLTEDGHETAFQVNFLSPFLLTSILTQHMRDTAGYPSAGMPRAVWTGGYCLPRHSMYCY
jgi:NAD(P)-dependent dehydrogenase (short-subunit alcohol dehydrogenase family)